jgi:hypothetical protein
MKREDFYIQEAMKYSQSEILNTEALAFIAGMKKADSYPNWIKVKDRMPELIDHCLCSVYVLITYKVQYEYVGEVRYTQVACYDYKEKGWFNHDDKRIEREVTHWMPIVLPNED